MRFATVAAVLATLVVTPAHGEAGSPDGSARETLTEAWWTGPLLAANASTLPAGHLYFEPYLYDLIPYARFDANGHSHPTARENDFGSLSYLNYGLYDRFTIGMIPRFGYISVSDGSSAGVGVGDVTLQAQLRLLQFEPGHRTPTVSINVQETLPTGRYERLARPSDGFGAGAETTTLSVFSQTYLWMPNGRIVRARLNLSYAISNRVGLQDISVYGTAVGFRGHANPGNSAYADLAFEYSITSAWVAAIDVWYEHDNSTDVFGRYLSSEGHAPLPSLALASGSGAETIVAPAVEYNFSARFGVIVGSRAIIAGRNETATVAPVVALSCFF